MNGRGPQHRGGVDVCRAGDGDGDVFSPVAAHRCAELPADASGARVDSATGADPATGADTATGTDTAAGADTAALKRPTPGSADNPAAPAGAMQTADRRVEAIRQALTDLRDLPLWTLSQADLLRLTREVESVVRSAFGVQVRLAGEIDRRGIAGILDARSAAYLLHEMLHITVGDARGRIAAATATLAGETPTGSTVEPAAPEILTAVDAGGISAGHSKVITDCLAKIPAALDDQTRARCRHTLLEQAHLRDEIGLRQVAEQIRLIVDPDGKLSGKDPTERAELHIAAQRRDGLTALRGLLDPLTAEQLRVAVEALAGPKPLDEHTPDPRSAPLRRAQALGEILHRYLTIGAGPRDGGVRPQVVVTIGLDDLIPPTQSDPRPNAASPTDPNRTHPTRTDPTRTDRTPTVPSRTDPSRPDLTPIDPSRPDALPRGTAWFDYGGVADPAIARMLACDAAIIPQVLGADSVVLDQGRAARLFTGEQRRALTTRDRGCAFPGCDIPPSMVRGPPHHLVVTRRRHRHSQRSAALPTPPRPDPPRPLAHRHRSRPRPTLVHPTSPPRPHPKTPTQQPLPPTPRTLRHPPAVTTSSGSAGSGIDSVGQAIA